MRNYKNIIHLQPQTKTINTTLKLIIMSVNLISEVKSVSQKDINDFGIIEVFILDGEVHTTSMWVLPMSIVEALDAEFLIENK